MFDFIQRVQVPAEELQFFPCQELARIAVQDRDCFVPEHNDNIHIVCDLDLKVLLITKTTGWKPLDSSMGRKAGQPIQTVFFL
jgi:hypothetical protein